MASLSDRMPPQDLDAEKYVLGSIMIDPSVILEIAPILRADDFYRAAHGIYYRVMVELHTAGRPVDGVEVTAELEKRKLYSEAGGDDYLSDIHAGTPHSLNAVYHAHSIRRKGILRELIAACAAISQGAYVPEADVAEVLADAESKIFAIANRVIDVQGPASSREVMVEAMERITSRSSGTMAGVTTGLIDLDEKLGGCLGNSTVAIVAARPGMGKSGLALTMCEHSASGDNPTPALLISLEMGKGELGERRLSMHAKIAGDALKQPWLLEGSQWKKLDDSRLALSPVPLWVDDAPTRTMSQIAAIARREKAFHGIGLLVVDYIQLIDGTGDGDHKRSRQEVVATLSRKLKVLAKELDIPVVVLSQLNRECEARGDKRPLMSDLRESGAIEQDADVVLLLHRPEYYDPKDKPGLAEIIVAKNRNGGTGRVEVTFIASQARFESMAFDDPRRTPTNDTTGNTF